MRVNIMISLAALALVITALAAGQVGLTKTTFSRTTTPIQGDLVETEDSVLIGGLSKSWVEVDGPVTQTCSILLSRSGLPGGNPAKAKGTIRRQDVVLNLESGWAFVQVDTKLPPRRGVRPNVIIPWYFIYHRGISAGAFGSSFFMKATANGTQVIQHSGRVTLEVRRKEDDPTVSIEFDLESQGNKPEIAVISVDAQGVASVNGMEVKADVTPPRWVYPDDCPELQPFFNEASIEVQRKLPEYADLSSDTMRKNPRPWP